MISESPDVIQAFQALVDVTPPDAIIFSWWDYGRPIQNLGERRPVVAYPSKDILQSVGASQNPIYALEMQIFGTYESSPKIHDVAKAFLLPEEESLVIMREYDATHVMVFHDEDEYAAFNDLVKFAWIARIAGYNGSDYVRMTQEPSKPTYTLTSRADQATMLRLLFDDEFRPQHFTKIYENSVAKIYRIDYSAQQFSGSPEPILEVPMTQSVLTCHCKTANVGSRDSKVRQLES